jgi:hypothetical protein
MKRNKRNEDKVEKTKGEENDDYENAQTGEE